MRVELGPACSFTSLPALVEVESGFFYLTRIRRRWRLLSSLCPHAGGEVVWDNEREEFICPLHGWCFRADGRLDGGGPALRHYRVKNINGILWAEL